MVSAESLMSTSTPAFRRYLAVAVTCVVSPPGELYKVDLVMKATFNAMIWYKYKVLSKFVILCQVETTTPKYLKCPPAA